VYFETNVLHGSVSGYVNLTNLAMGLAKANQKGNHGRRLGVYTALGIGLVHFETIIKDLPGDGIAEGVSYDKPYINPVTNKPTGVGGYLKGKSGPSTTEVSFPFSVGVKYKISKRLDLGIENTLHLVMTDKLDGYAYDRNSAFKKNNDKFSLSALTLTYKFAGKDENIDYIEWMDPTEVMYDDYQMLSDKLRKLSSDTDNDGVADIFDKEPNTPAGVVVDGAGRAVDSDGDGVPDYKDADPFSPKGATVDADGKPVDSDGDGVPDVLDKEPNTKPGSLVNQEGKTIKQDFATKDDLKNASFVAPTVYFDVNSSTIKAVYYPELAGLAKYMKSNNVSIVVTGHTDITGSESSNMKLGQRRADAVKEFLVKYYNIDASRIETRSEGKKSQLYKQNYQVNRRADVELKK
jgi:OOP family OmpA-OmpF porin